MSHMDTSGTFLFPIDNRNILLLLRGTSFLIDVGLCIDGAVSSEKFDGVSGTNPRI